MQEKKERNKKILKDRQKGLSYYQLAKKYELSPTTIADIVKRQPSRSPIKERSEI